MIHSQRVFLLLLCICVVLAGVVLAVDIDPKSYFVKFDLNEVDFADIAGSTTDNRNSGRKYNPDDLIVRFATTRNNLLCEKRVKEIENNELYCAVSKKYLQEGLNTIEAQFINGQSGQILKSMLVDIMAERTEVLKVKQEYAVIQVPRIVLATAGPAALFAGGAIFKWFFTSKPPAIPINAVGDYGGGDGGDDFGASFRRLPPAYYNPRLQFTRLPRSSFVQTVDLTHQNPESSSMVTYQQYFIEGFHSGYREAQRHRQGDLHDEALQQLLAGNHTDSEAWKQKEQELNDAIVTKDQSVARLQEQLNDLEQKQQTLLEHFIEKQREGLFTQQQLQSRVHEEQNLRAEIQQQLEAAVAEKDEVVEELQRHRSGAGSHRYEHDEKNSEDSGLSRQIPVNFVDGESGQTTAESPAVASTTDGDDDGYSEEIGGNKSDPSTSVSALSKPRSLIRQFSRDVRANLVNLKSWKRTAVVAAGALGAGALAMLASNSIQLDFSRFSFSGNDRDRQDSASSSPLKRSSSPRLGFPKSRFSGLFSSPTWKSQ
jgi:hypothetical protein